MESGLIDVVCQQFWSNFYVLLIEDTFVTSHKTINFSILSHQSINDVMTTRTLSTIETNSDPDFSRLSTLSLTKCHNLMTSLRKEGIVFFNRNFELLCLEFQLLAKDEIWMVVKAFRIFNGILEDCCSQRIEISAVNDSERLILWRIFLFIDRSIKLVNSRWNSKVRLSLRELIL